MNDYLKKRMSHILADRPIPERKKTFIKKVSDKRAAKLAEQKEKGGDNEMDLFFEAMRKRCKGKCFFCSGATLYKDNERWRIAIAHLLPKRPVNKGGFPSVSTNENNWVELCWDCHTDFDTGKISWELLFDSKEAEIIKEKLLNVLPMVSPEERKHKLYARLEKLVYNT